MINYNDMTKEEVIELLQEAVADKKKKLLEDIKACLNIHNRNDLDYDTLEYILDSLSATTEKTEDLEKAIDYVEEVTDGAWLPDNDRDIELFVAVTIDVYKIRGLERLIGYLS